MDHYPGRDGARGRTGLENSSLGRTFAIPANLHTLAHKKSWIKSHYNSVCALGWAVLAKQLCGPLQLKEERSQALADAFGFSSLRPRFVQRLKAAHCNV